MAGFTRRSHIVRIASKSNPEVYVDMEVLDAVAFTNVNGDQLVLNVPAENANPYIVDNTGDGNGKVTATGTRRSHMKRITSSSDSTQFLDIEVLDAIAFRDQNGQEWIMNNADNGSLNVYNTTTGQGDVNSTRRVHDEKVYSNPGDTTSPYMLVERCDTISFRNINGDEMVIVMPSSDDGSGSGRASTFTTPAGYDPTSTTAPPANGDPEVYAFIPPGSAGMSIGTAGDTTTKVACGPLWWPRGINTKSGPWYWYIPIQTPSAFSIKFTPGKFVWDMNPSVSSWAGTPPKWELVYLQGILTQSLNGEQIFFTPFQPFGWGSLDDAILNGEAGFDWGVIDFSDTRIDGSAANGLNANACVVGVSGNPDIWQLTGISAPPLIPPVPPAIKWLPGAISPALAAQAATAWGNAWNATSAGYNNEMAAAAKTLTNQYGFITWPFPVDNGATQRFLGGTEPATYTYPSSAFAVPLYDLTVYPPLTGGRYIGGLPGDFWPGDVGAPQPGTIGDGEPGPYAELIGVAQLSPAKWNTSDPNHPVLKSPTP